MPYSRNSYIFENDASTRVLYRFNGNATDETGVNNGTVSGGSYVSGLADQCLDLSGSSSIVTANDHSSLDITGNYTAEIILNADARPSGIANDIILWKGNSAGSDGTSPYSLGWSRTTYKFYGLCGDGSAADYVEGTRAENASQWYYIALVRNGSTLKLYINGVEDASVSSTRTPVNTTYKLQLCGLDGGSSSNYSFDGKLDEFRLSATARSATDIWQNWLKIANNHTYYGMPKMNKNTIKSFWSLDDNNDFGSLKNTITNNGATSVNGQFIGGLSFNGSSSYLSVGGVADYSFVQNSRAFTLIAWIYPANTSSGAFYIMGNTVSPSEKGFYWAYNATNNRMDFTIHNGDGSGLGTVSGNAGFSTNTWYMVAVTGNGSQATHYINGRVSGTVNQALDSASTGNSSRTLDIGRYNYSSPSGYFNGSLCGIFFDSSTYTSQEIYDIYRASKGAFSSN